MICTLIGVELVLQGADRDILGTVRWRSLAYQNGAFWPGLLRDWQPNYPLQPATMFASYALLHGGFSHAAGNAITIAFLGPLVCGKVGQRGFVWICITTAIGGGLGFAMLNESPQPMIGASGVVFGLAGALMGFIWETRLIWYQTLLQIAGLTTLLVVLNAVTWWALDGLLAWETHFGGFVAGFAVIFALPWRR